MRRKNFLHYFLEGGENKGSEWNIYAIKTAMKNCHKGRYQGGRNTGRIIKCFHCSSRLTAAVATTGDGLFGDSTLKSSDIGDDEDDISLALRCPGSGEARSSSSLERLLLLGPFS